MKRLLVLLGILIGCSTTSYAQCGTQVVNPGTGKKDCVGNNLRTAPVIVNGTSVTSPYTITKPGIYICDIAGGCTFNLYTITAGLTSSKVWIMQETGRSGSIIVQLPSSTVCDKDGAIGATAGTITSTGALGESALFTAVSTTKYKLSREGLWTVSQ